MAKKLYVGNLSYSTTKTQIRDLFAQAGEIAEVDVVMDRDTGQPRGFAFVHMPDDIAAQDAIRRFNGYALDDRPLNVSEAHPRAEHFSSIGTVRNDYDRGNKRF